MDAMATRRQIRERDVIPFCGEEIQALWETEEGDELPPTVWWRARVHEVTDDHRCGILATGKLEYVLLGKYESCLHEVDFLPGRLIRRLKEPDEETAHPAVSWRVAPSQIAAEQESCDSDWVGEEEVPLAKKRRLIHHSDKLSRALGVQVLKIRRSHAELLLELTMLRRQVLTNTERLQGRECNDDMVTVNRLMLYLRQRISLQLQKPLKLLKKKTASAHDCELEQQVDSVSCISVKARVDCDLEEFEEVARVLRSNCEDSIESVKFFPEFSMTRNPKLSATEFFITFESFTVACNHLGITSKSDQLEMTMRYGWANHTQLLRILGTYVFDEDKSKLCAILPGQSCGLGINEEKEGIEGCPALLRDTREWNIVDRRFVSPLYRGKSVPSAVGDLREDKKLKHRSLHLRWGREKEPSTTSWSKEMIRSTEVAGWIELVFPAIQVSGDILSEEVSSSLSDSVLASNVEVAIP